MSEGEGSRGDARARRFPVRPSASRWSLLHSVLVVATVLLALLTAAAVALITTEEHLGSAQAYQTEHLDAAQNQTAVLLGEFVDQESGLRGYLLDGQSFFLEPYKQADGAIPGTEAQLAAAVTPVPGAAARFHVVTAAYRVWFGDYAQPQVTAIGAGHVAEAQTQAETGLGKQLFDQVRGPLDQLRSLLRTDQVANQAHIVDLQNRLEVLLIVTLAAFAAGIVIVVLTTLVRIIRPLRVLTTSARAVADGELRAEVPISGPREFRGLGADVAAMRYRLLEEINRARLAGEALRHDGPTVAALHEALLPRNDQVPGIIAVGRLVPAEGVLAGDWYDLIRVDDTLAMVIGDVSGHGPASAVLALGLRAVLSTVLSGGGSPGNALAAAAASVADDSPEHFATVFVAVIDPVAGRLRYANAGHPAAIVHRAAALDGTWTELAPTGPLISPVVARWSWSTQTQPFGPGDALLAYTDGITEGRNATNEEYGIERLKHDLDAALPSLPTDAVNLIAANVDRFVGASQSDDRTLLYCHRPAGSRPAFT